MSRFDLWCARTVRNWRWWLVLPLLPVVIIACFAQWFGEWAQEFFHRVFVWQKRGWKA